MTSLCIDPDPVGRAVEIGDESISLLLHTTHTTSTSSAATDTS